MWGLRDFTVLWQESIILLTLVLCAVVIVFFFPSTLPYLWMLFLVSAGLSESFEVDGRVVKLSGVFYVKNTICKEMPSKVAG